MSSVTGSISSLGIGSGLDVTSIINSLIAADSQPLVNLQNQASTINTEISAVGQIKSLASTLEDRIQALTSRTLWSQTTSSSSNPAVVTADTSGDNVPPGDYSVTVQQLAQGQTCTAAPLGSSASTLSTGTLTIQLGTWSGDPPSSFASKDGSDPVSITIGPDDTSLASIRDKINGANAGVTASIITDASGARLSIRSATTGEENGFKITASEDTDDGDPDTGLSMLQYDPSSPDSELSLNQGALNAQATINGIAVESDSNTFANVSDGLSLTVGQVSATPVDVQVTNDTASQTTAINAFVSAYNALNSYIHDQTKYDSGSSTAGPLIGDPSIIGFQNRMRETIAGNTTASSMFSNLSSMGISVQTDGSLAVDSTKLSTALDDPEQMQDFWTGDGTDGTSTGFGVAFQNLVDQSLDPTDGQLTTRYTGLKAELSRNTDEQTDMQTHLDAERARLTAQYEALDTTMAQMNALSSYVTQQMTLMEKA
jgi:flagellar hook-associated protein 2